MEIVRSPEAVADLASIWSYIAHRDLLAADRMIDRIVAATDRLADYPESGRPRSDIRPDLRSIPAGSYVVYYRVEADHVRLLRIVHGARDMPDEAIR